MPLRRLLRNAKVAFTALLLGAVGPLAAQSPAIRPPQSATVLEGLQRLDVLVTVAPECGATDDALGSDTRLAVRRTGLGVDDSAAAYLAIAVKCATGPAGVSVAVQALVVELVAVPRLGPKPDIGAAIWQHGAAYLSDGPGVRRQVRAGIAAAVDRLERDWKTANPARRP